MTEKDSSRRLCEQSLREASEYPFFETAAAIGAGNNEVCIVPFRNIQKVVGRSGVLVVDARAHGGINAVAKQVLGDVGETSVCGR